MRCILAWALLFFTSTADAAVYKCKTAQGTVYSQSPCAANAEQVRIKDESAASKNPRTAPVESAPTADIDLERNWPNTTQEALALLGKPQGLYYEADHDEYWLYAVGCKLDEGVRKCPELRVVAERITQINWHPEATMQKAIRVAAGFGDWTPKRLDADKTFTFADVPPVGSARAAVVAKLGEPDYKRVFQGIEVWEYHKVRVSREDSSRLTLFLEFDGDRISQSIGN